MKRNEEERQLTKAEMEIMNVLWEKAEGMTTYEIIEEYPEPTFLKILTNKNFIHSRKQEGGGKTFVFTPTISREAYTNRVMKEVKSTFFAGSLKSMLSFFAKQEEVSEKDLQEIMEMIKSK